ncbi:MAG TPA: RES domain-containing protein [Bryobacteraceae bacterium]|nr:RES domain-containing protein [Bryobacteraceae bacterium]
MASIPATRYQEVQDILNPDRTRRTRLMRAYRLNRSLYSSYDGEGARRAGGRWNLKGTRVIYRSENRWLCVLEVLAHLTDILPDRYVPGQADIPGELRLPSSWKTLLVAEQTLTRQIGDDWVARQSSAILFVPSVVLGEKNILLHPEHPDFRQI